MQGYLDDIERATLDNEDYRRALYTGRHLQLVLMTLQPGEEIGEEVHEATTSSSASNRARARS